MASCVGFRIEDLGFESSFIVYYVRLVPLTFLDCVSSLTKWL